MIELIWHKANPDFKLTAAEMDTSLRDGKLNAQ